MEQTGKPGHVHVSEEMKSRLEQHCRVSEGAFVEYQGTLIKTYIVEGMVEAKRDSTNHLQVSYPHNPFGSRISGLFKSFVRLDKSHSMKKMSIDVPTAIKKTATIAEADEEFQFSPPGGRDSRIHRWWLTFLDSDLEKDYQASYIDRCTGKMAISVLFTIFSTFILMMVDVVVYIADPAVYIIKSLAIAVQMLLFILILARYEEFDNQPAWMIRLITCSRALNYNFVGPFIIILLFVTAIPQLTVSAGVLGLMAYHYATLHITIMNSAVFDRSRSTYINVATYSVVIMILGNLNGNFLRGNSDDQSAAVTTWGFIILMNFGLHWITNRMEYQVRQNFLMKRELIEKKYEIEDLRARAEKMLYTLLPKEIVTRYVYSVGCGVRQLADG